MPRQFFVKTLSLLILCTLPTVLYSHSLDEVIAGNHRSEDNKSRDVIYDPCLLIPSLNASSISSADALPSFEISTNPSLSLNIDLLIAYPSFFISKGVIGNSPTFPLIPSVPNNFINSVLEFLCHV